MTRTIITKLDATIDEAFPALLNPCALARLMRRAKQLHLEAYPHTAKGKAQALGAKRAHGHDLEPESGGSFIEYVVTRAHGVRGWSRSAAKERCRHGENIAPEVLDAIEGSGHETVGNLNVLAGLSMNQQMGQLRRWQDEAAAAEAPEVRATGEVVTGHGYEMRCADSALRMEELAQEGVQFGGILTDIPYGIGHKKGAIANDEKPHVEFVKQMARLLKPGRALILCAKDGAEAWPWTKAISQLPGWSVHEVIDWTEKGSKWFDTHAREVFIVASKGPLQTFRVDQRTAWPCPTLPTNDPRRALHPSPKPPTLFNPALHKYSQPGDVIFDPFAGLAPIGEACVSLGRSYVGVELLDRHFRSACGYLADAVGDVEPVALAA